MALDILDFTQGKGVRVAEEPTEGQESIFISDQLAGPYTIVLCLNRNRRCFSMALHWNSFQRQ